jgi:hypothetical protein
MVGHEVTPDRSDGGPAAETWAEFVGGIVEEDSSREDWKLKEKKKYESRELQWMMMWYWYVFEKNG